MLEVLELSNPKDKAFLYESYLGDWVWVIPDLYSKMELQQQLLRKQSYVMEEKILRSSDLWTFLLQLVRPDLRILSTEYAQALTKEFLASKNISLSIQSLFAFMDKTLSLLVLPHSHEMVSDWFEEHKDSQYRWKSYYECARKVWSFLLEQKGVPLKWVSAALYLEDLSQIPWKEKLIFDLSCRCRNIEADLIGQLHPSMEVKILVPSPSWNPQQGKDPHHRASLLRTLDVYKSFFTKPQKVTDLVSSDSLSSTISTQATQTEQITQATQTEQITQATQTEQITQATQTEQITQATQTEQITQATQTEQITQATQTEQITQATQAEQVTHVTQAEQVTHVTQTEQTMQTEKTAPAEQIAQVAQEQGAQEQAHAQVQTTHAQTQEESQGEGEEHQFFRFTNALAEVKHSVATVREWLEKDKIPLRQIAIFAPQMNTYWPVLSAYLEQEGIPFHRNTLSPPQGALSSFIRWMACLRLHAGLHHRKEQDIEYRHYLRATNVQEEGNGDHRNSSRPPFPMALSRLYFGASPMVKRFETAFLC